MFKEGPKKGGFWYLAYTSAFPQWESKQVVPEMESLADWLWVFIHAHFATSFWIIKLIKYLYSGPCSWSRVPNLTASLTLDSNGSNEGSRWRRWMSHSVPSPCLLIKRMCKYTKQQEFHFSPVNIGTDKKTSLFFLLLPSSWSNQSCFCYLLQNPCKVFTGNFLTNFVIVPRFFYNYSLHLSGTYIARGIKLFQI